MVPRAYTPAEKGIRAGLAMAIKFMDKEPEDGQQPKKESAPAKATDPTPMPIEPVLADEGAADSELPGLALPKPEPRMKGRKKPFG